MNADMIKHLEFIQGVINRHNSNSFMLKGWAITIASALYALAGTVNEPMLVLITIVPILLFWGLDAFYLSNERCFVDLYNAVVNGSYKLPKENIFKKEFDEKRTEFSTETIPSFNMNIEDFKIWRDNHCYEVAKSKTIFWFYFPLSMTTILILLIFCIINTNEPKSINVNAKIESDTLDMRINERQFEIIHDIYTAPFKKDTVIKK